MVASIMTIRKEPSFALLPVRLPGKMLNDVVQQEVYGILFHPDLIRGTSLGKTIKNYTFFLLFSKRGHLSDQEKETVMDCLKRSVSSWSILSISIVKH